MTASMQLAEFAASLKFDDIPAEVTDKTLQLLLDWLGSSLAGSGARPVIAFEQLSEELGPDSGPSQIFASRRLTSPLFAALVNAAASHVVEQDDLHNQSVFHPGTVVFPPVIAVAQAIGCTGKDAITAAVVGYEVGIRIGEFLGRSHYRIFHTTATAGTLAAAVAVSSLLKLDADQTLHALGSAGTQAAGLWEFLRDAADSKQLHTGKAAMDGIVAAYAARHGLTGARQILEGDQGMAVGMLGHGEPAQLLDRLGQRWALPETSFKFHASCRHTHPAADALLKIRQDQQLDHTRIRRITAHVYQAAQDVLGAVKQPHTIHQSKFSMGFVLALIARDGRASVSDFTESALDDMELRRLHDCVSMVVDPDIDRDYPNKWTARVEVELDDGSIMQQYLDTPKGDPDNSLSREEIEDKFRMLSQFSGAASADEAADLIDQCWRLAEVDNFSNALKLPPRE